MGLGLSGRAAAGFLARRGVRVVAADAKPPESLEGSLSGLDELGATLRLGPGPASQPAVFTGCDIVIVSPGVAPEAAPLAGARRSGIPLIAEVELASRFLRGVLLGITGSNGKSTVTALVGHILEQAGRSARVCGNIGTALTAVAEADLVLDEAEAREVHYVVELSSFQLEGIETLRPRIAALLNLSPDHQDRYEAPADYYAAKARIFMNQVGDDIAVINWDDAHARAAAERLMSRLFPFSLTQDLEEGAVLSGDSLRLRRRGSDEEIMKAGDVPLAGRHNLENVLAAASIAAHCEVPLERIARAVSTFRGLPHRLERVAEIDGVSWYNDSKATNVGSTVRAVEAFDRPIVLLLGGRDKGGDFEALRAVLAEKTPRLRGLVAFGEAGSDIARRVDGVAPATRLCGSLAQAVEEARRLAEAGDVVLLAPGCASFDAYTGFDARGEDFRSLVAGPAAGEEGVS